MCRWVIIGESYGQLGDNSGVQVQMGDKRESYVKVGDYHDYRGFTCLDG